jgi:protein-tyrosine kinase
MGKMFDALQKVEREKFREQKEDEPKATPEDIVLNDKLVSFFQPSSMVSEQFRRLRTFVLKPGLDENAPKTILVTSAMAAEGKSLIAVNLAITIATELHSFALLVDCDLRNPSLSRMFGLDEKQGLSNYILGEAEIPDLLIKTSIDKLSFIPGGSLQENPVELIGSNRMRSLVQDLKSRYNDRYIILDSSPILATTEPSVLNKLVDGIILVVRSGETPRESVLQAMKMLDREKILGVVLNDMQFMTKAMIRKNFGTHNYYYNYRYSRANPKPSTWGKFTALGGDMKMFLNRRRARKKDKNSDE